MSPIEYLRPIGRALVRAFDSLVLDKRTLDLIDLNHVSDGLLASMEKDDIEGLLAARDALQALRMRTADGKKKRELMLRVCWFQISRLEQKHDS